MKSSRRRFLKLAGIAAIGLGSRPVFDAAFAAGGGGHGAAPLAQRILDHALEGHDHGGHGVGPDLR